MKEVRLSTWEDFEAEILFLFQDIDKKKAESDMHVSYPFFRGQTEACWSLDTTLERYAKQKYSARDYYNIMCAVKLSVESFTDRVWHIPDNYDRDESHIHSPQAPLGYEFMIYLRHHGFPSPLLDWTRSPYVAAFFAFRSKEASENSSVAIYSYVEYYGGGKGGRGDKPRIVSCGPYVVTHRRHYSQQSEYTICEKHDGTQYIYWSHEDVFGEDEKEQDIITKYVIPRSEREKVMKRLEIMNITSYSLFGNEESLMETLAYREIERGQR